MIFPQKSTSRSLWLIKLLVVVLPCYVAFWCGTIHPRYFEGSSPPSFQKKSITLPVATTSFWLTSWSIGRNASLFWLCSPVTGPMVIIAPMNVMRDRMMSKKVRIVRTNGRRRPPNCEHESPLKTY